MMRELKTAPRSVLLHSRCFTFADAVIPADGIPDGADWQDIPQGGKLVLDGAAITFGFLANDGTAISASFISTPTLAEIRAAGQGGYDVFVHEAIGACYCVREKAGVAGRLQWDIRNIPDSPHTYNIKLNTCRFPALQNELDLAAKSAVGEAQIILSDDDGGVGNICEGDFIEVGAGEGKPKRFKITANFHNRAAEDWTAHFYSWQKQGNGKWRANLKPDVVVRADDLIRIDVVFDYENVYKTRAVRDVCALNDDSIALLFADGRLAVLAAGNAENDEVSLEDGAEPIPVVFQATIQRPFSVSVEEERRYFSPFVANCVWLNGNCLRGNNKNGERFLDLKWAEHEMLCDFPIVDGIDSPVCKGGMQFDAVADQNDPGDKSYLRHDPRRNLHISYCGHGKEVDGGNIDKFAIYTLSFHGRTTAFPVT